MNRLFLDSFLLDPSTHFPQTHSKSFFFRLLWGNFEIKFFFERNQKFPKGTKGKKEKIIQSYTKKDEKSIFQGWGANFSSSASSRGMNSWHLLKTMQNVFFSSFWTRIFFPKNSNFPLGPSKLYSIFFKIAQINENIFLFWRNFEWQKKNFFAQKLKFSFEFLGIFFKYFWTLLRIRRTKKIPKLAQIFVLLSNFQKRLKKNPQNFKGNFNFWAKSKVLKKVAQNYEEIVLASLGESFYKYLWKLLKRTKKIPKTSTKFLLSSWATFKNILKKKSPKILCKFERNFFFARNQKFPSGDPREFFFLNLLKLTKKWFWPSFGGKRFFRPKSKVLRGKNFKRNFFFEKVAQNGKN